MDLLVHLDRLNYHEAWIGEHHSAGFEIIACPEMFIAAAAERTRHIRLGTGVVSLPYHNPFTVAGRHDAARLHDARPRHVRRRAGLARLRRHQDGAQGRGPAAQARRVARRHHGADAGPHGDQEDRLVRPAGSAPAAQELLAADDGDGGRLLALADRRAGGRQARHRHAVDRRHVGRRAEGARQQLGRLRGERAGERQDARPPQVAHRHLRPRGGDARAGARRTSSSGSRTSIAISREVATFPIIPPDVTGDPAEYLVVVGPRLHRHAGRLRPPFRAAVEGLERRPRRHPAAGAQLGGLAGDACAATS